MMPLSALGDRICILGPSNSGKSTLADAIARKLGAPVVHLDVLFHLPGTDWEPRPFEDFKTLHDAAVRAPRWVIDGNYSQLLPRRLEQATGWIRLDISTPLSLFRYVRRSLSPRGHIGAIEGNRARVKWEMLRHICTTTRQNRRRYAELERTVQLPGVHLLSARQISACYREWDLRLPSSKPQQETRDR